jgi:hypothetical protein
VARWLLWPLFAAIMGLVVGGSVVSAVSQPNQEQHIGNSNAPSDSNTNQHQPSKTSWQALTVIWDRTWEDPVAFYTFVLSIFTALLAIISATQIAFLIRADRTARITAEAADLNARAVVAAELPILAPSGMSLKDPGGAIVVGYLPQKSIFNINFRNSGRTAAELIGQSIEWVVASVLQDLPGYKSSFPFTPGTFVDPGKYLPTAIHNFVIELRRDEVEDISQETRFLWIYGYISFKDFLGYSHEQRWCAKWQPFVTAPDGTRTSMGFVYDSSTPPGYTRRT